MKDVRAIVIHKPTIYSAHLRDHKERFYNYFVKTLIKCNAATLSSADIRIDGSGGRVFKQEINTYVPRAW